MTYQNQQSQLSGFIRLNKVKSLTGLSTSTIWRLERDGKFPRKRQLSSNAVGWLAADIQAWIMSRQEMTHAR